MDTNNNNTIPDKQRALVLQGGGSLGAYECGVFQTLSTWIRQRNIQNDKTEQEIPLFDVIAGTSIGAINAAVLVGHFLKNNRRWAGAERTLLDFWNGLKTAAVIDGIPFNQIWEGWRSLNPTIARTEVARRFWSMSQYAFVPYGGIPNMYTLIPQLNYKFLNPFDCLWLRSDFDNLKTYLSKFIDFPIKTSPERKEPRLLLVSVDLQDYTTPVVFDSYEKKGDPLDMDGNPIKGNSKYYSEYGKDQNKHVVFYDGINADQILASSLAKLALRPPSIHDVIQGEERKLWDGGYLSNTPLRELIQSHRDYWIKDNGGSSHNDLDKILKNRAPALEVFVVDLHPSIGKEPDNDKDLVDDREHDIFFHDRTDYDEKVAYLVSDYVNLTHDLINIIRPNSDLLNQLQEILDQKARSVSRSGKIRALRDIISGRFDISNVWRIDCPCDEDVIYGKFDDFSPKTIEQLILNGKSDAVISLNTLEILFTIKKLFYGNKSDEDSIYNLMKKPKQWLLAHLYYGKKDEMYGHIEEFVSDIDISTVVPPEQKQLFKDLSSNILNELNKTDATSLTTSSTLSPLFQLQTIWS
jgi:NTE family protein